MLFAACLLAVGLHPRPVYNESASFARWLVHESDYAVVSTLHNGLPFGNIASISDGNGYEASTGIIYTCAAATARRPPNRRAHSRPPLPLPAGTCPISTRRTKT